jgi:hypothetical protein
LTNGYLSWVDSALGSWFQLTNFNDAPVIKRLGRKTEADGRMSAREFVHRHSSPEAQRAPMVTAGVLARAKALRTGGSKASESWAHQIESDMFKMTPA